jgi:hypothetical protein
MHLDRSLYLSLQNPNIRRYEHASIGTYVCYVRTYEEEEFGVISICNSYLSPHGMTNGYVPFYCKGEGEPDGCITWGGKK